MEFGYVGQVVLEKLFEIVDGRTTTTANDGRRSLPILKAPPEPSAQVSYNANVKIDQYWSVDV